MRLSVRLCTCFGSGGGGRLLRSSEWSYLGLFSERCRRRLLKLWAANRQQSRNIFYFFGLVVVVVDFILDLAPLSLSFVF